jgi:hypothetical protein
MAMSDATGGLREGPPRCILAAPARPVAGGPAGGGRPGDNNSSQPHCQEAINLPSALSKNGPRVFAKTLVKWWLSR